MSELISGKEALIALANGEDVQFTMNDCNSWHDSSTNLAVFKLLTDEYKYRLKPRTITINGIELPAPFAPKEGDRFWFISSNWTSGYSFGDFSELNHVHLIQFGAWRTEDQIKQVVAALRQVFKGE